MREEKRERGEKRERERNWEDSGGVKWRGRKNGRW